MRKVFVLVSVVLCCGGAKAQQMKQSADYLHLDMAAASYRGSLSASFLHDWRLGTNKKFGFGLGARFTSFLGANQYYITAPAELTSGSTGPLVIFKENITENIDSLLVKSPQVNALNLMINLDYQFSSKLLVGFNIDAVGFSFGANKQANFMSGTSGKNTTASPTPFNLLLISDNDLGTLNSELYLRYFWNDRWGAKIAAQFLFTEYTTTTNVQVSPEENDRFRNKSLLFSIGVSYKLLAK
jgi:hypothetical protein